MNEPFFGANSAEVVGEVDFGVKTSVWHNATIRSESFIGIGKKSNVQDNCVLHSKGSEKTVVGEEVTVGYSAVVHGSERKDNCLIGINSSVLTDSRVGENTIVAANALVPENEELPPDSVVMGVPGKVVRKTKEEEIDLIKERAQEYYELAKKYKNNQKKQHK
ncbi:MAG: Isoleucine patch superfamily protein [Candidatus Methanohalarchaeum thermophilum]|uniref:Isoleucine patch superfamily protein n=1 Tax=Methanohalarchaeum thermophilum TaxID=1903181 RepID=A0A1Q6DSQ9_METT1|nr:MAG: Isoleucine patch superfamily protein [Candidatus Methanohalarchaeum thermophilum]